MTRDWSRGRITTRTSNHLQLLRYPSSKPIRATRPVSEHGQPHMRSPLMQLHQDPAFGGLGSEDENHSRKRRFRPWLATVRLPGSARTDQVLGDDGISCGRGRLGEAGGEPPNSVAAVAARWIDSLQLLEVEIGNSLQLLGQPRSFEIGRQIVEPGAVLVL